MHILVGLRSDCYYLYPKLFVLYSLVFKFYIFLPKINVKVEASG